MALGKFSYSTITSDPLIVPTLLISQHKVQARTCPTCPPWLLVNLYLATCAGYGESRLLIRHCSPLIPHSHTNAPKYTCPGCTARTCSLPCVKKHKQRASCSGKRDPTKYVKSSQLLTAAGIDHDYNFISGIERDIAKKDQSSFDRKSIRDGQQAPVAHVQRNQRFLNRLQETKVMVEKAPTGMARQRQNRTRALKGYDTSDEIGWS